MNKLFVANSPGSIDQILFNLCEKNLLSFDKHSYANWFKMPTMLQIARIKLELSNEIF